MRVCCIRHESAAPREDVADASSNTGGDPSPHQRFNTSFRVIQGGAARKESVSLDSASVPASVPASAPVSLVGVVAADDREAARGVEAQHPPHPAIRQPTLAPAYTPRARTGGCEYTVWTIWTDTPGY